VSGDEKIRRFRRKSITQNNNLQKMAKSRSRSKYQTSRNSRIDSFKKKFLGLKGAHHLTNQISGKYSFMKENNVSKANMDYSRSSRVNTSKLTDLATKTSHRHHRTNMSNYVNNKSSYSSYRASGSKAIASLQRLKGKISRIKEFKKGQSSSNYFLRQNTSGIPRSNSKDLLYKTTRDHSRNPSRQLESGKVNFFKRNITGGGRITSSNGLRNKI
jgi:hypothetical protein